MKRTTTVVLNPRKIRSIEISFDPADHMPSDMTAIDSSGRRFLCDSIEQGDATSTLWGEMVSLTGHFGASLKVAVLMKGISL